MFPRERTRRLPMMPLASEASRRLGMMVPAMRLTRAEGDREADVGGRRAEEADQGGRNVAQWEAFGGIGRSGQDGCRSQEGNEEGEEGGGMHAGCFFSFFLFGWLGCDWFEDRC